MNDLTQAIQFATECHEGQRRKYIDEPYINHPVRVMQAVACDKNLGGQERPAIAAVLHDVIEDCDVEYLDTDIWGWQVPHWVEELTHKYTHEAYPHTRRRERKRLERERLAGASFTAQTIKFYDRIDNLESWFIPGTVLTDEMIGFGRVYAQESWDLMMALANPDLNHVASRLAELAAKLREVCK